MKNPRAELRGLALETLKIHAYNVARAAPRFTDKIKPRSDLLDALVFDYLSWVASGKRPKPPSEDDVKVKGAIISKHQRGAHKRARPRTLAEKTAALHVAETEVDALRSIYDQRKIDGRPIGDLAWGELRTMVHFNAISAGSLLRLGNEATENALLLDKIEGYAMVQDHLTKIREIVPEAELQRFIEEARQEAPRVVEIGMRNYATLIESHRGRTKEISK